MLASLVLMALGPRASSGERSATPAQPESPAAASSPGAAQSPVAAAPVLQEITVELGDYFYQPAEIVVQPGEIQFTLTNVARRRHTFNVQDSATGADLFVADLGASRSTTMAFTPPTEGTYRIYCNVTDHAERGQVGTLIVSRSARS